MVMVPIITSIPPTRRLAYTSASWPPGAVPVADDVKLQVEFDPQMVESYRLIGYANRIMADEDFRNDGADAGELCAGVELTVAYEIVLTDEGRRHEGDEPWLTCAGALSAGWRAGGGGAGRAAVYGEPRKLVRRARRRLVVGRGGRRVWHARPGLRVRRHGHGR